MKSNAAMRKLLEDAAFVAHIEPALREIVDGGFVVKEGCHLLAALEPAATNVTRANFPDCTGYECFVNSIHVEDYDDKTPLCQAIQFVMQIFAAWLASTPTLALVAIISVDEFSVVVKFHAKHQEEQWLSENIEGYEDPVMSMESSEDLTVALAEILRSA
jgi:hypothetical protein